MSMREIHGKTRTSGLIGNPVEHTMSPLIHNFLAEEMGIEVRKINDVSTEDFT